MIAFAFLGLIVIAVFIFAALLDGRTYIYCLGWAGAVGFLLTSGKMLTAQMDTQPSGGKNGVFAQAIGDIMGSIHILFVVIIVLFLLLSILAFISA